MRKMIRIWELIIFLVLSSQASNLTPDQFLKLKNPVAKDLGKISLVEEYNRIIFDNTILFDGKKIQSMVIKTEARMPKGLINKEQFIAISSTLSDQIIKSIFMAPQYFLHLKSIELLTQKPNKADLIININFRKDGLNILVTGSHSEQRRFISYHEIFFQRLK